MILYRGASAISPALTLTEHVRLANALKFHRPVSLPPQQRVQLTALEEFYFDAGKETGKETRNCPSHRTLEEAGDAFFLLGRTGTGRGLLRRLEIWHAVAGAALHRGALGGGGCAHL